MCQFGGEWIGGENARANYKDTVLALQRSMRTSLLVIFCYMPSILAKGSVGQWFILWDLFPGYEVKIVSYILQMKNFVFVHDYA